MGASGGIVGIDLRAPSNEQPHALETLKRIVPYELLWWDDCDRMHYREVHLQPGIVYSTYGSFQEWSLDNLENLLEAAKEYGETHPTATFKDWTLDIYVNSWPGNIHFQGGMVEFLASRYLGYYLGGRSVFNEPRVVIQDDFYEHNVAAWARIIEEILDLESCFSMETWT